MSDIKIEKHHSLGRDEAHRRVVEMAPKLRDKYGVKLDWQGDKAQLKGSGVSGHIDIDDSKVEVQLKLGLLLRPMSGKIREAIERQIDRALA